jgi:hypothetical protein
VLWRWETLKSERTKPPYQPNGRKAKNNDPVTWSTYDAVLNAAPKFDGIGFVIPDGTGAFDVDHCRDPNDGTLHPWAQELVDRCASYAEITPSGTGIRIIGNASGPPLARQKMEVADGVSVELYRKTNRYITVTGNQIGGYDSLADIDAVIDEVHTQYGEATDGAPEEDADKLERTIKDGCYGEFGNDRSNAVYYVACEMLRRGHAPSSVVDTLLDQRGKISEHVYDQADPPTYAERQVRRAVRGLKLARDEKGVIFKSTTNVRIAMAKLGVVIRRDLFADRNIIDGLEGFGPYLNDDALNRLLITIEQRFYFGPGIERLGIIVSDTALVNAFHPVLDYLGTLRWDGKPRIDTWLTTYGGAEDSEYTRAVGALFFTAAVRRVRSPGCKFDEMVVLETPEQGTEKSTVLSILSVREDWFTDDLPLNADTQKVIERVRGRWIIEAAELAGMRRGDIEHLKAFLSRRHDRARMAYGRLVAESRQCVIVGTTNAEFYLKDQSGNRRFWPVRVKRFDLAALTRDRDQLWAEAAAREASGASIRLPPHLWAAAAVVQEERVASDPIFDALHDALGDMEGKIASEAIWTILDVHPGAQTQDHNIRVGHAMRKLGWDRPSGVRIGGKVVKGYTKGKQPFKQVHVSRERLTGALSVSYGLDVWDGADDVSPPDGGGTGEGLHKTVEKSEWFERVGEILTSE